MDDESRQRTRTPLGASIALFAVICGIVLLLVGAPPSSPVDEGPAEKTPGPSEVEKQLQSAFDHAQKAEQALDASNYGDVRTHLRRTEALLTGLLSNEGRRLD